MQSMWYDDDVDAASLARAPDLISRKNMTPKEIYDFLNCRVYKQDEAKRAVAMFAWKTIHNIKSNMILCGPTGCGKTELFRALNELFSDMVAIIDVSSVTLDGWSGKTKWSTVMSNDIFKTHHTWHIACFDEFDKVCEPKISSSGENYSAQVLSQALKILEGTKLMIEQENNKRYTIDTSTINFAMCGAFSNLASDIAEQGQGSKIGFNSSYDESIKAYDKELTADDIIKYGVPPEFLGRIGTIVNLKRLTEEDYYQMLMCGGGARHKSRLIERIQKEYGISLHLNSYTRHRIASEAFEKGLGVRYLTTSISNMIDEQIFENPQQKVFEF